MVKFLKLLLAVFLSMLLCGIIFFFILAAFISSAGSDSKPTVQERSVLVVDLTTPLKDYERPSLSINLNTEQLTTTPPNLNETLQMIRYAAKDERIKAIYIKGSSNVNGFATSQELRSALEDFKTSGKKIIAFAPTLTQTAYYVASVADELYVSPEGGVDWTGLTTQTIYFKRLLDKLEIHPEIFYAGKFKSATEPFRREDMSEANRLQTATWLGEIYGQLLSAIAESRGLDTLSLHQWANQGLIRSAHDALDRHMVDALVYPDQVEVAIQKAVGADLDTRPNLISTKKYNKAADYKDYSPTDRIAVLYAQGDISSGAEAEGIQSERYVSMMRDIRKDSSIKALVLRVNSPGGSALASDLIWREITLTKKVKPVIVSMGDLAASGGYYISCGADYIFAEPTTLTGSIGVFSMMGSAENLLKNKIGITFDQVKTAPHADLGSIARPLTEVERRWMQASVDSVYHTFTSRVADGRGRNIAYIDSIGQGRVWTGLHAKQIGLVDAIGGLDDAIHYAAKKIKSPSYRVSEFPVKQSLLSQLLNSDANQPENIDIKLKEQLQLSGVSAELAGFIGQIKDIQSMMNIPQAKLPFEFVIE